MTMRPREPRYAYDGKIRLMVPFDPWRLLVTLQGLDLSMTGVAARLDVPARKDRHDADALLVEGDPYDLQLEHGADHLAAPFLRARLARRRRTPAGLELAFAFEEPDGDLLGLVHDLGATSRGRP
jgi:hypothetical protein